MDERRLWTVLAVALASLALGACATQSSATSSPTISSSPSPTTGASLPAPTVTPSYRPVGRPTESPTEVGQVSSPAQAAALVLAANPLFAQVLPANGGASGQAASYTASLADDGFAVSVTLGSGDCQAGCINTHTWNYSVNSLGSVELVSESGDDVEISAPTAGPGQAHVTISLVAGPVCPVERDPPDPSCAPRPVVAAPIVVRDPTGALVASATADQSGQAVFELSTGAYYAEASPANGLMRQPAAEAFSVVGGATVGFSMEYDTGIR